MSLPLSEGKVLEIDGKRFAYETGKMTAKAALALVATGALFLVIAVISKDYAWGLLVVLAALLSLLDLFYYSLFTPRNGAPPSRGLLPMLIGIGAWIPYGLGCYLTFYEGLWGLLRALKTFGFLAFLLAVACLVLGLTIVNGMYRMTEICSAVDKGRIIVRTSERIPASGP